jgi:hypothetical protein
VYAKLGEACELDPGYALNKIGHQQKITMKTMPVKLRNFATFLCEFLAESC